MFPLQCLHRAQGTAKVVGVEGFSLFLNPILGLINVAMESLDFMCRALLLLSLFRFLLQRAPPVVEMLNLLADSDRRFGLADGSQCSGYLVHLL
jgi:hypothetical protein